MSNPKIRARIDELNASKLNNYILLNRPSKTVLEIIINRPDKYNALGVDMYIKIGEAIRAANKDEQVKFIVIRGNGKVFSSGNDLKNFSNPDYLEFDLQEFVPFIAHDILEDYCKAILQSDKPIYAIVQGKAIGVAFTQLALFDKVFAVEGTTFKAPLVRLAQGPEMASSYTFPKLFGNKFANELIVGAKQVTAKDLQKYDVLDICKDVSDASRKLNEFISELEKLDWTAFVEARRLMRHHEKKILLEISHLECKNLVERWLNPELPGLMLAYLQEVKEPKSKL